MKVVKIGGCNGSGKTSLVRELMTEASDRQSSTAVYRPKSAKVEAYTIAANQRPRNYTRPPLVILGDYSNVCGGMDTISDKEDRLALLQKYAVGDNIVVYEGLITGKTYGAMGEISERPEHRGHWIYAFMDTPFDVCVERVLQRRKERGNINAFDSERTMRPTYKAVLSTAKRAASAGHAVYWIKHTFTAQQAAANLLQVIDNFVKTGDLYNDK